MLIADVQDALFTAVGGLTGVVGFMWMALQKEITRARAECEEDRKKLWELVRIVSQLDRRRDWSQENQEQHHG